MASAVFDPLAKLDAQRKATPYLAKTIAGSDEHKTWTIETRTGVTFHDGTDLTAQVVADNLEAGRKSLITAGFLTTVTSIAVPDPTHVVVTLASPMVAFLDLLTTQVGYVISEAILKDPALANKPVGTGPFVFRDHVKDKSWTFTKNPKYWQAGLPHLDALDILPLPDNTERLTKLKNGDVDMMNARSPQEILDLRSSDFKRVENANGEEDFVTLNTQSPPFDNPIARQAVAYATDSERWRSEISLGVDDRATGPFVKSQPGYLEDNGYPAFNLDKAKQLVTQYRQETGKDLEFTFHTQADINVQQESQLLQSLYEQAGMKVNVVPLPQINLITVIAFGGYQMGRFRLFSASNPDADAYFWRSSSISPSPGISLNFPRFATGGQPAGQRHLRGGQRHDRDRRRQDLARLDLDHSLTARPV